MLREKKLIRRYYKCLFMLVIVFVGVSAGKVTTHAAINNTIGNAQYINTDGTTYSSNILDTTNARFYKFTLNESGTVTLNLKAYILFTDIYVYDSDGKIISKTTRYQRNREITLHYSYDDEGNLIEERSDASENTDGTLYLTKYTYGYIYTPDAK